MCGRSTRYKQSRNRRMSVYSLISFGFFVQKKGHGTFRVHYFQRKRKQSPLHITTSSLTCTSTLLIFTSQPPPNSAQQSTTTTSPKHTRAKICMCVLFVAMWTQSKNKKNAAQNFSTGPKEVPIAPNIPKQHVSPSLFAYQVCRFSSASPTLNFRWPRLKGYTKREQKKKTNVCMRVSTHTHICLSLSLSSTQDTEETPRHRT